MTTRIEKTVTVDVPLRAVYDQWTQFEEFPRFMDGVERVTQIGNEQLQWVAKIGGVRREWLARIVAQVPDRKVAWAAVEGAVNAGEVTFAEAGPGRTSVHLVLEFEPEGFLEIVGDRLNLIEKQAEGDLDRFKAFLEARGEATGSWRGTIAEGDAEGTPSAAEAGTHRDEPGVPGASGAAVAAGTAALIAGGAAGLGAPRIDEAGGSREDLTPGTAGPDAS